MTPARRRELAEKWASKVIDPLAFPQFLESAFLELEREVREECAKVCCLHCADGRFPAQFGVVFKNTSDAPEWFHLEPGGAIGGDDLAHPCDAAAIRAGLKGDG